MRWKCTCAYDGTDFDGWQRQPGGGAVQNHIESALTQVFDLPLQLHGSGRTDAGVHARGQCFHFDAEWLHKPEKLVRALHSICPHRSASSPVSYTHLTLPTIPQV